MPSRTGNLIIRARICRSAAFIAIRLYLDVEKIEDFALTPAAASLLASPKVPQRLAALRDSEHVEYEKVWAVKFKFLKLLFRSFLREYRTETARRSNFGISPA